METLTAGRRVRVYAKPAHDQEYEGDAELVQALPHIRGRDGLAWWLIRWDGEPVPHKRLVHPRHLVARKAVAA